MTVQPTEAPAIDLELLVGDMPEVPCEHRQHDTLTDIHQGPATHYAKSKCVECGRISPVMSLCAGFVAYILRNGVIRCKACRESRPALESIHTLVPVK